MISFLEFHSIMVSLEPRNGTWKHLDKCKNETVVDLISKYDGVPEMIANFFFIYRESRGTREEQPSKGPRG